MLSCVCLCVCVCVCPGWHTNTAGSSLTFQVNTSWPHADTIGNPQVRAHTHPEQVAEARQSALIPIHTALTLFAQAAPGRSSMLNDPCVSLCLYVCVCMQIVITYVKSYAGWGQVQLSCSNCNCDSIVLDAHWEKQVSSTPHMCGCTLCERARVCVHTSAAQIWVKAHDISAYAITHVCVCVYVCVCARARTCVSACVCACTCSTP